jgi:exodeoxyribonuclease-3
MKIITWNVAGYRALLRKNKQGLRDNKIREDNVLNTLISEQNPDIICLQETKCPCDLSSIPADYIYNRILASTIKKGYSGVAIFSKIEPIAIYDDFMLNEEGRLLCFEFSNYYVVNAYVPNSKSDLSRLNYRIITWETKVREYITKLQESKPVIFAADFNVAQNEIDIHNPKNHEWSAGFTIDERTAFAELLKECNLIDPYRFLYPNKQEYTYFSNFVKSRERNIGWRLDYILVSSKFKKNIKKVDILGDYYGSDHVPVLLEITPVFRNYGTP